MNQFGNMDPDDIRATDSRKVQPDVDEPISEQEGANEPYAVAKPGSPGAADRPPQDEFEAIAEHLVELSPNVARREVNGQPGLAVSGVAFAALVGQDMAFRLGGEVHHHAWRLDASKLWDIDPQVHDAPETEWVLVRYKHSAQWQEFAEAALSWASRTQERE